MLLFSAVLQNTFHRQLVLLIVDALRDNFQQFTCGEMRGLSDESRGLIANVRLLLFLSPRIACPLIQLFRRAVPRLRISHVFVPG